MADINKLRVAPIVNCPLCGKILGKARMGISAHLRSHNVDVETLHKIVNELVGRGVREEVFR